MKVTTSEEIKTTILVNQTLESNGKNTVANPAHNSWRGLKRRKTRGTDLKHSKTENEVGLGIER